MNVTVLRRGIAATAVVAASALIAVGCGSSSGSGAADAAKNAKGLDFVPADAIMYMTFDTDLEGDNWSNIDDLAPAFYEDVKPVSEYIDEMAEDSDEDIDYKKDIEPWLGDTGGIAITGVKGSEPKLMAWIDLKDREAFEEFAKDQDLKKDGEAGDFALWKDESGDDDEDDEAEYVAVSDDVALLAENKKDAKEFATFDGDSIKDADGIGDVVDKVEGDAMFAMVLSGDGVREAIKDSDEEELAELADNDEVKKFEGMSLTFSAEDKGFRVHGYLGTDGLDKQLLGTNGSTDLVSSLPGDTMLAIGGNDLGGSIKSLLDLAGDSNDDVADAIGTFEGFLGVSPDDLATAFGKEWTFSVGGSDESFMGAVGTAVTSVVGGGDPTDAASSLGDIAATLAFVANGDSADTLEKLFGATQMATGTPPEPGTAGDFETMTAEVEGMPITAATNDDLALITTNAAALESWGDGDTLGDNKAFSDAWKAADAPDKVSSVFFLDFPRIAKMAGLESGGDAEPGGWVAWSATDGDDATFDVFMHIDG